MNKQKGNQQKQNTRRKQQKKQRVILGDTHSNVINSMLVTANGRQPNTRRGEAQLQFIDLNQTANPLAAGVILSSLTLPPQGITVSSRISDTIYLHDLVFNYFIKAFNSALTTNSRIILFQWHPSTSLGAPIVADILQAGTIQSAYTWQTADQYTILYDRMHYQAGSATTPVSSSSQGYSGRISIAKAKKKIQFESAATTGTNQLFILLIADQAAAPLPNFTGYTRVVYSLE